MASSRTLWTGGLRRILRPGPQLHWMLAWVGTLVGIELLGRRAASDAGDAVGVMALASLGLLTWVRHGSRPLPFVRRLEVRARRAWRRLQGWRIRLGLDLRGKPPLPERLPRVLTLPFVGLIATCLALALSRHQFPGNARALAMDVSCAAYVLALTALWSALIAGLLLTFALPLIYVDVLARRTGHGERSRQRLVLWSALVYLTLLVTLARLLPVWAPLAMLLATLACFLFVTLCCAGKPLFVLWRHVRPRSPAAVFRWSTLTVGVQLTVVSACLVLVLLARGDALFVANPTPTPLTSFLGLALAWSFLGAYLVELVTLTSLTGMGWSRDPARPRPTSVLLEGALAPSVRHRVRAAFAGSGLRAIFAERAASSTEVPLVIDRLATGAPDSSAWPRRIDVEQLSDPALHASLHRRAELLSRRALRKGLQRLLRRAGRQRFEKGSGFLIAPHLWVVTHLVRDVDEDEFGRIGPSYARSIPLAARHHAHRVFEALEIDLIFLEDGLRFRALQRVLAMMFEHYDIFGSGRPVDERHFSGLPGIRVLIHEYEIDEPLDFGRYPEPDYEHLGRARILHIFRDRGGDEELPVSPRETDWIPAPRRPLPV